MGVRRVWRGNQAFCAALRGRSHERDRPLSIDSLALVGIGLEHESWSKSTKEVGSLMASETQPSIEEIRDICAAGGSVKWAATLTAAIEREAALAEALRKYGDHAVGCNLTMAWHREKATCDCGFEAVLAAAAPSQRFHSEDCSMPGYCLGECLVIDAPEEVGE